MNSFEKWRSIMKIREYEKVMSFVELGLDSGPGDVVYRCPAPPNAIFLPWPRGTHHILGGWYALSYAVYVAVEVDDEYLRRPGSRPNRQLDLLVLIHYDHPVMGVVIVSHHHEPPYPYVHRTYPHIHRIIDHRCCNFSSHASWLVKCCRELNLSWERSPWITSIRLLRLHPEACPVSVRTTIEHPEACPVLVHTRVEDFSLLSLAP